MKFFFAKREHICLHCRAEIRKGEAFVRLEINNRQGTGQVGLLFHIECFPKWNEASFIRRFLAWRESQILPRKLGRPRIPCLDRHKRRKLLSLMIYHRKAGNEGRVQELQREIDELEGG